MAAGMFCRCRYLQCLFHHPLPDFMGRVFYHPSCCGYSGPGVLPVDVVLQGTLYPDYTLFNKKKKSLKAWRPFAEGVMVPVFAWIIKNTDIFEKMAGLLDLD
jgi:hypothetical protein